MTDDELEAIRADLREVEVTWLVSENPIGSESEIGHLVEQPRVLLAEVELLRALVGEPEWEYGVRHCLTFSVSPRETEREAVDNARFISEQGGNFREAVRRRKAGRWEPVPETGDDRG